MKHVGCAVKESLKFLIGHRDASVVTDTGGKTTAAVADSVGFRQVTNVS